MPCSMREPRPRPRASGWRGRWVRPRRCTRHSARRWMATTAGRATETRHSPITNVPVDPDASGSPASRRTVVLGIAALFAVGLVIGGAYKWYVGLSYVGSDDAQVEGHIIPVLPRT